MIVTLKSIENLWKATTYIVTWTKCWEYEHNKYSSNLKTYLLDSRKRHFGPTSQQSPVCCVHVDIFGHWIQSCFKQNIEFGGFSCCESTCLGFIPINQMVIEVNASFVRWIIDHLAKEIILIRRKPWIIYRTSFERGYVNTFA